MRNTFIALIVILFVFSWSGYQLASARGGDNVYWNELYHNAPDANPESELVPGEVFAFRQGAAGGGIYPDTTVTLYLLADEDDLSTAYVHLWDGAEHTVEMAFVKTITAAFRGQPGHTYDLWKAEISPVPAQ